MGHDVRLYATETNEDVFPELRNGVDVKVVPLPQPISVLLNISRDSFFGRIVKKWRVERQYVEAARRISLAMDADFDAVNCHEDFAYKTGYFYKKINPRARIVWTMNFPPYMRMPKENTLHDLLNRAYVCYKDVVERRYFNAVDHIVVLSRYEQEWARARSLPVSIVWSGTDFNRFYSLVKRQAGSPATLLGLGALTPARRFEDLIDAVAILRRKGYAVRADIVSKDIWNEAEYRAFLIKRAQERGVENDVRFNFNGVSSEKLRETYASSDVFVLTAYIPPPQGYGWGSVVFEAAAAGVPVVLYRSGGAAHILTDGENALFTDPKQPGEIAAQVARLLDDHALYRRIATGGQQFVKKNLSWSRYASEMVKLYTGSSK
jgi:glycosyltransferase involved in cell wall biosynthesis